MIAASDALHRRVQRFIASEVIEDESFDELACDIARFQAAHIEPVRRLYAARQIAPHELRLAADIPAVPTDAFRLRRIAAHASELDARVFATSGTTSGARGRHSLRRTDTYAEGAMRWAQEMLLGDEARAFVGLVADEHSAPDSSLSFMLARFAEQRGDASWHVADGALDIASLRARITALTQPALVAGTSFAFVHLCDACAAGALALPAGSRVMQTGGFKGRSREVDEDELRTHIASVFGVAPEAIVTEYGMTELSSQLYQDAHRIYRAPPWLRVNAVDPLSLAPHDGEGVARFVDLANVDSAVAIQTADRIRHVEGGIVLLGRTPGAPPRGCSLALEHLVGDGS
jgi:hypothetical protein